LTIHAILSKGDKEEDVHLYLSFEHNRDRSWASEQHHPTRRQIEEHLTQIILEEKTRTKQIATFLTKHLPAKENPVSHGKSIQKVLKKDHPKIVKIVEKYSDVQELKDGTAELIIEILKKKKRKLGRGDKESYEEFWYLGDGRFHYEEGDTLGYGHPHHEEIFQSEEKFKEFLKRRWIQVKDGIITGPGQPTMFIPYWLKDMGLGSIREYIEAQKKK